MDQQHGHGARFSLRQRAGWLRVWLIASIGWFAFAASKIDLNWRPQSDLVITRAVYGENAAAFGLEKGKVEARSKCIDQSIKGSSEPDPIPEARSRQASKIADTARTMGRTLDEIYPEERAAEQAARVSTAVKGAPKMAPQQASDIDALAKTFGVPAEVVKVNPDLFNAERAASQATEITNGSPRLGSWLTQNELNHAKAQSLERDRRIKARDFHTHIIRISCVLEKTLLKELVLAVAIVFGPPLAVPLLCMGLFFLFLRLGRWLLAGFRVKSVESSAVPATVELQTEPDPLGELAPKQHAKPQMRERWKWHHWALVALAVLVTSIVHGLLSKQTNRLSESAKYAFVGWRNESQIGAQVKFEESLRKELPKAVGDNVTAVDVSVNDKNLAWTYQRQGPGQMSDETYLDSIASKACKSGAIREIAKYGVEVEYRLIDISGKPLGNRTVKGC